MPADDWNEPDRSAEHRAAEDCAAERRARTVLGWISLGYASALLTIALCLAGLVLTSHVTLNLGWQAVGA